MAAIVQSALCVLAGVGVVAWCVRLSGLGLDWAGRHLLALIVAASCVAFAAGYAGVKPPSPPGPGPEPPARTNVVIRAGIRADGTVLPYGAPVRDAYPF